MKLVIIDDDCLVSGALKTILEASGEVTVAATGTDGTDAVRLYREHLPDILLMDIRMKQMDGLQATVEIRKEFSDANILLLTTFSDDEYIVKALRSGARGYLLKQDYTNLQGRGIGADRVWLRSSFQASRPVPKNGGI